MAVTDQAATIARSQPDRSQRVEAGATSGPRPRGRGIPGPDRLTVVLISFAGFLVLLAVLASQFRPATPAEPHPVVVLRRIYEKRVIETIKGKPGARTVGGTSVTQSVSSSGSAASSAAPTTRAS